jgi:hypothetical protein
VACRHRRRRRRRCRRRGHCRLSSLICNCQSFTSQRSCHDDHRFLDYGEEKWRDIVLNQVNDPARFTAYDDKVRLTYLPTDRLAATFVCLPSITFVCLWVCVQVCKCISVRMNSSSLTVVWVRQAAPVMATRAHDLRNNRTNHKNYSSNKYRSTAASLTQQTKTNATPTHTRTHTLSLAVSVHAHCTHTARQVLKTYNQKLNWLGQWACSRQFGELGWLPVGRAACLSARHVIHPL